MCKPRDEIEQAVRILRRGGVVAHACEGVWGLACDPWNESAVKQILTIKNRSVLKGLIVIAYAATEFSSELDSLSTDQRKKVEASWPGHTTWLLPTSRFPTWITGGRATVAVRVPDHRQARALCERFGGGLVSTSANRSTQPPATTADEVFQYLGTSVDLILPGAISGASSASRIQTVDGRFVR